MPGLPAHPAWSAATPATALAVAAEKPVAAMAVSGFWARRPAAAALEARMLAVVLVAISVAVRVARSCAAAGGANVEGATTGAVEMSFDAVDSAKYRGGEALHVARNGRPAALVLATPGGAVGTATNLGAAAVVALLPPLRSLPPRLPPPPMMMMVWTLDICASSRPRTQRRGSSRARPARYPWPQVRD